MKGVPKKCKFHTVWLLAPLLITSMLSAQSPQKKLYTSDLDSLWSRSTYINNLTNDGNWAVFTEAFDLKENVLWLKHTTDTTSFKFYGANWIRLANNNRWLGCITSGKNLNIVDFERQDKQSYSNVDSYAFSNSGDYVAVYHKPSKEKETLVIINLLNQKRITLKDVQKYIWHPSNNSLLMTKELENQNQAVLFDVEFAFGTLLNGNSNNSYTHFLWSDQGNELVFSEQGNHENFLHHYSVKGKLRTLNDSILKERFPNYKISNRAPFIAKDGTKILFYRQIKEEELEVHKETMEVWNSDDPLIYPKLLDHKKRKLDFLLTAWYPEANKLMAIETEKFPTAALDVNHNHAVVYDELKYEPIYKEFPTADIYVKNLESGQEQLVVENQYIGPGFVTISPQGKYIAYFKDAHWWVYNIEKRLSTQLTLGLEVSFVDFDRSYTGEASPIANPGWSENDEYILLTDHYDIWLMSPENDYKERLTNGREERITHRISKEAQRNSIQFLTVNRSFSGIPLKLQKGFVIELYKDAVHNSGYAIWNQEHGYERIVFENKKVDGILISANLNYLVYRKQRFNEPPAIYGADLKGNKSRLLYQSNAKLLDYDLGRAQFINYKVNDMVLTGSLIYPANYNPNKKHPLIVSIYEKISGKINTFDPPSLYDYIGFNTLKYTTNDYFILYPDITYKIKKPGESALKSVKSAVNKAMESGSIDKNKIGLIGHSFGGYETAFIATQTDMFAAAVAGAAITNITSYYHSVGWNFNQPEIWRFETQQWRMKNSYYDEKEAYLKNSPLHHAENINTPLLLWTGKKDYQVYWTQSVEMFLAIKRQKKQASLLLFDNEQHALMDKSNQKKLSLKIMEWFDKYCK